MAKERAEKIAFAKLRETAAATVAGAFASREAAETAVTIERQARDAAEAAVTIERQAREAAEARATTLERQVCEIQGQAAADAARAATNAQQLEAQLAEQRQRISDYMRRSHGG